MAILPTLRLFVLHFLPYVIDLRVYHHLSGLQLLRCGLDFELEPNPGVNCIILDIDYLDFVGGVFLIMDLSIEWLQSWVFLFIRLEIGLISFRG